MTPQGGRCGVVRGDLDLYLDRELSPRASEDVKAHLNGCETCSGELRARMAMRGRLRAAVKGAPVTPGLESRLRRELRREAPAWPWLRTMVAVAAVVVLCVGGVIAYRFGGGRTYQRLYIAVLSSRVSAAMRIGLGDHIHCAVFRKFPEVAPTAERMARDLGPEYSDLIAVLKDHVPPGYSVVMAHECGYGGRKFIHLTARNGRHLMSLVISGKGDGETFAKEQLAPVLAQSGIPVYQAGVATFEISGFETRGHFVYLVSDLSAPANREVMVALASGVREVLRKIES